jgi:septal ring factor EnvC (AmiA/AmiB activator)
MKLVLGGKLLQMKMTVGKKAWLSTLCLVLGGAAVLAYSSGVRNSLLRSRDQVADQRFHLEKAYSEIDKKIDGLQRQKQEIGRYLQDCDRTIREIDRSLTAHDAAHTGR